MTSTVDSAAAGASKNRTTSLCFPVSRESDDPFFQQGTAYIDLDYVSRWLAEILGSADSRIERLRETVETAAKLMAE